MTSEDYSADLAAEAAYYTSIRRQRVEDARDNRAEALEALGVATVEFRGIDKYTSTDDDRRWGALLTWRDAADRYIEADLDLKEAEAGV